MKISIDFEGVPHDLLTEKQKNALGELNHIFNELLEKLNAIDADLPNHSRYVSIATTHLENAKMYLAKHISLDCESQKKENNMFLTIKFKEKDYPVIYRISLNNLEMIQYSLMDSNLEIIFSRSNETFTIFFDDSLLINKQEIVDSLLEFDPCFKDVFGEYVKRVTEKNKKFVDENKWLSNY